MAKATKKPIDAGSIDRMRVFFFFHKFFIIERGRMGGGTSSHRVPHKFLTQNGNFGGFVQEALLSSNFSFF